MGSELILVVDDNREIADFMAGDLLHSLGYETLVAYSGRAAMEIIRSQPLSLLVCDLQLPDTTGIDLVRHIHEQGFKIPTILVTAHGSEQVAVDALRLGVHDYLIKPVEIDSLGQAVARALNETRLEREKQSLTEQLKEQISWLTILSRIGKSVTSTLELDDVLRRIVEAGVHLTRADEGFLALLDQKTGQINLRAVKNIDSAKSKTLRTPVSDSLLGTVITTGKPLRRSQITENNPLKVSTGFLVHSVLHVPIFSKGRVLGVLSVDNQATRKAFKEVDEALLTSLADYAAVAIENASLYQQAQQEINERKRIELALRESQERYSLAVRAANDGLWDWDLKTNRVYYSPRWKAMLGFDEAEVGDRPEEWFDRIHPDDLEKTKYNINSHYRGVNSHFEGEHRMRMKDSTYRWMQSRGIAIWDKDGVVQRMVGSLTDIDDRKRAEQKLLHDAFHDSLTDLPNRNLFMDRLRLAVERAKRRDDYQYAVLFLDLDRFKDVNDSQGHLMGDQLLIEIGKILGQGLRATDTVARFGGDEFVILLEDITDISDATNVCDRIMQQLAANFPQAEHEVVVTTSIGIVLSKTGYNSAEDVLRDSDIAMYRAKQAGRARYEIFDRHMRDKLMERLHLEADMRQAFDRHELRIHYQPIVNLTDHSIHGCEALVRWQHPSRGILNPDKFIPLSEETGLIFDIGRWVMREACSQLKQWQQQYHTDPPLTISINLSVKQVTQINLVEEIRQILDETGLDPHFLMLEITENAIIENMTEAVIVFEKLQAMGIQVQIDDFGVGYSTLGALSRLPVNTLKIDQSFIGKMTSDNHYFKIVQAIVVMAHGLGMNVIAEGVETEEQLHQLAVMGCEMAQGYFLSIPIDRAELTNLLTQTLAGQTEFSNRSLPALSE